MIKKYSFAFDVWGLILFLLIMLPNIIWFMIPAPNDILRQESTTRVLDTIGSIAQVVFVALICATRRKGSQNNKQFIFVILTGVMVICYFTGWVLYYMSIVNILVISLLTITPCLSFIFYNMPYNLWLCKLYIIYGRKP